MKITGGALKRHPVGPNRKTHPTSPIKIHI